MLQLVYSIVVSRSCHALLQDHISRDPTRSRRGSIERSCVDRTTSGGDVRYVRRTRRPAVGMPVDAARCTAATAGSVHTLAGAAAAAATEINEAPTLGALRARSVGLIGLTTPDRLTAQPRRSPVKTPPSLPKRPQDRKGKGSPYSTAERTVPELIPVLGSQPSGDVSHEPGGRLPSARPAITLATVKRAATSFAAW